MTIEIEAEKEQQATGIYQGGVLHIYHKSDQDTPQTKEKARELLLAGEVIEVPAAGAASYREVAEILGLGEADDWETSSSAGDWLIRLDDKPGKFLVQTNRFPRHGFAYMMIQDTEEWEKGERDWRLGLHPGDEVTWTDPDNGECTKTAAIHDIEYKGLPDNVTVCITWADGGTTEAFLNELS